MLLVAGLLVCSLASFATPSSQQYDDSKLLAQAYNNEQVVTAYYVSGNQLCRIILRVSGSYVTGYCTGKNYLGQYEFTFVPNASIRRTNDTMDGQIAREYSNTATLNIGGQSIKVFF